MPNEPLAFATSNSKIAALVDTYSWTGTTGTAAVVKYATSVKAWAFGSEYSYPINNVGYISTSQANALSSSLTAWSNVANITFTQVSSASTADIVVRQATMPSGVAGWVLPSALGSYMIAADLLLDRDVDSASPGNYDYLTILHEVGHALGLKHTFEDGTTLLTSEDNTDYSITSYSDGNYTSAYGVMPITPMYYDIAAIQYLYGANTSYRSGNTVIDVSDANGVIQTVWDGGGSDVFSTLSYSGAVQIDLREGISYVSHVGSSHFWVAAGANIENATSGAGNDSLQGNASGNYLQGNGGSDIINAAEGNDYGFGGDGNDALQGNTGADYLEGGTGNDTVYGGKDNDFVQGNTGSDDVNGNNGSDEVHGGRDNDTVRGGQDNDWVNGEIGNDLVFGDLGDDTVRGGQNEDSVDGGVGNDSLYGDLGNDTLTGGAGSDTFYFAASSSGIDNITDFASGDRLSIAASVKASAADVLAASSVQGSNTLITLSSDSTITLIGYTSLSASDILIG